MAKKKSHVLKNANKNLNGKESWKTGLKREGVRRSPQLVEKK